MAKFCQIWSHCKASSYCSKKKRTDSVKFEMIYFYFRRIKLEPGDDIVAAIKSFAWISSKSFLFPSFSQNFSIELGNTLSWQFTKRNATNICLMAFSGVTNAHGPSPQPTACRSPFCRSITACYISKTFI